MYAVVSTGGKQYKVAAGDILRVEKLEMAIGEKISFGTVHLVAKEDALIADPKALVNAKVMCEITRHGRAKKIRVFKFKRRKQYRRTYGHRQSYTEIRVSEIQA
ncbi:MAG: 50S ribosomal protein L21 [Candidatus Hydrogenedentota bacterium]